MNSLHGHANVVKPVPTIRSLPARRCSRAPARQAPTAAATASSGPAQSGEGLRNSNAAPSTAGPTVYVRSSKARRRPEPEQPRTPASSPVLQPRNRQQEMADEVIAVFAGRKPNDWRKLIAHSKQWPELAVKVFRRLEERLEQPEGDPLGAPELRKLLRRLTEVHEETKDFSQLIARFEAAPETEWEGMVAGNRTQLTTGFFEHVSSLINASIEDRQKHLVHLSTRLFSLVQSFDGVLEHEETVQGAEKRFEELITVGSMQEMNAKLDQMAAAKQLDPALMLMLAKAHNSVKDTDKTEEDVKEIMAHLYYKAKEKATQQHAPELRILKHVLAMHDLQQRSAALREAFTPGPMLEVQGHDMLSTTPEALMQLITALLDHFDKQRGLISMTPSTRALARPAVIERMRQLQGLIRKEYM